MRILIRILSVSFVFFSLFLTSCNDSEEIVCPVSEEMSSRTVYTYPHIDEILQSNKVYKAVNDAWNEMLSYVTPHSRREIGFYIYYDFDDKDFWIGEWFYGPLVPYDSNQSASVKFGEVIKPYNLCAFFHCHTPYYGPGERPTGPSDADIACANKLGVPGILFDYPSDYVYFDFPYDYGPMLYMFGPMQRGDLNLRF